MGRGVVAEDGWDLGFGEVWGLGFALAVSGHSPCKKWAPTSLTRVMTVMMMVVLMIQ